MSERPDDTRVTDDGNGERKFALPVTRLSFGEPQAQLTRRLAPLREFLVEVHYAAGLTYWRMDTSTLLMMASAPAA
jgi:hypothetical protein